MHIFFFFLLSILSLFLFLFGNQQIQVTSIFPGLVSCNFCMNSSPVAQLGALEREKPSVKVMSKQKYVRYWHESYRLVFTTQTSPRISTVLSLFRGRREISRVRPMSVTHRHKSAKRRQNKENKLIERITWQPIHVSYLVWAVTIASFFLGCDNTHAADRSD